MTTRIGPDQAVRPRMTTSRARAKAVAGRLWNLMSKLFWVIVFCFIAAVITQRAWDHRPGVLLVVLAAGAAVGLWVGWGTSKNTNG